MRVDEIIRAGSRTLPSNRRRRGKWSSLPDGTSWQAKEKKKEKSSEFVEAVIIKCNFAIPQNCHLKFCNTKQTIQTYSLFWRSVLNVMFWGVGRFWANKALEGQAIVCEQSLAPPILCIPRAFRRPWLCSVVRTFWWTWWGLCQGQQSLSSERILGVTTNSQLSVWKYSYCGNWGTHDLL